LENWIQTLLPDQLGLLTHCNELQTDVLHAVLSMRTHITESRPAGETADQKKKLPTKIVDIPAVLPYQRLHCSYD